jgi:thiol-disulfide isomerase/thioredoxin
MLNKIKNKIAKMPLAFKILGGIFLLILVYCIVNKKNLLSGSKEQFSNGDVVFTWYHADFCGHCQNMKGEWEQLKNEWDQKVHKGVTVHIKDYECTNDDSKKYCEKAGISAYPTMILTKGLSSDAEKIDYDGGRTFDEMQTFLKNNL